MNRLTWVASIFVIFSADILWGQIAVKPEPADSDSADYVSVEKISSGENVLAVRYPWKKHEKASLEVRLIPDKNDFAARVKPLRLASMRIEPETQKHIFKMFDDALTRPSTWSAEIGGIRWEIFAQANYRDRGAYWFITTPEKGAKKENEFFGNAAVFTLLDPWVIDNRLMMFDLPRKYFGKPGKMYVWFLRGDRIVWQQELMWPGQQGAKEE
jgi:hypothetical protein